MRSSKTRRGDEKDIRKWWTTSVRVGVASVAVLMGAGCGPALEITDEGVRLVALDGRGLDGVSPVSPLVIEGLDEGTLAAFTLEDIWLVRGEVSSASSTRLARRDVPDSIESARQPVTAWRKGAALVVAPARALDLGETYSVVVLGVGHIGQVVVATDPVLFLERKVTTTIRVGDWVPYCASSKLEVDLSGLLAELPEEFELAVGFAGTELSLESCISVRPSSEGLFVPPAAADEILLDPAPFDVLAKEDQRGPERPPCRSGTSWSECVHVRRGALEVEWGVGTFALRATPLNADGAPTGEVIEWVGEHVLPGFSALGPLVPETNYRVEVARWAEGKLTRDEVVLASGPALGRVIVNEVMANPAGLEPATEWIELLNVGAAAVDLDGFLLRDAGGETALPSVRLEPGEFGLVVRGDFSVDIDTDVVPDARAHRIVVATIGKSGLSNSGEPIELVDAEGHVVSAVPALPSKDGISLARLDPWLPDEARSFGEHADPGASPGAQNRMGNEVE